LIVGEEADKAHADSIKNQQQQKREALAERKCPKCGSPLKKIYGKYGEYFGCSAFPKCKFKTKK